MKFSKSFIYTQQDEKVPIKSKSHSLLIRTGMIHYSGSGLYNFLPLGNRVLKNIEKIIREEMEKTGCLEVSLPLIQSADLWKQSNRWEVYGNEMWKLKDRHEVEYCLGPTHEEMFGQIIKDYVKSYKELPITLYQIGRKFRDEMTPRLGLIRAREFIMKDAYSFHADEESLTKMYNKMKNSYYNIFKRLNLEVISVKEDPGEMGGSDSEEFLAFSSSGEDNIVKINENMGKKIINSENAQGETIYKGLEIGHIFKLGDFYSKKMNINFMDDKGEKRLVIMGCYGIGVSRIMSAIIEQNSDEKGIIWPKEVSPFDLYIIPINLKNSEVKEIAEQCYSDFKDKEFEVLFDDRDINVGNKFHTADLLGIPYKLIIGDKGIKKNVVEFEERKNGQKVEVSLDSIVESFERMRQ